MQEKEYKPVKDKTKYRDEVNKKRCVKQHKNNSKMQKISRKRNRK